MVCITDLQGPSLISLYPMSSFYSPVGTLTPPMQIFLSSVHCLLSPALPMRQYFHPVHILFAFRLLPVFAPTKPSWDTIPTNPPLSDFFSLLHSSASRQHEIGSRLLCICCDAVLQKCWGFLSHGGSSFPCWGKLSPIRFQSRVGLGSTHWTQRALN